MTRLLDQALEAARRLASDVQDDIARVVLQLAGSDATAPIALSADEREAVAKSRAAAARGEFATDGPGNLGQTRAVKALCPRYKVCRHCEER